MDKIQVQFKHHRYKIASDYSELKYKKEDPVDIAKLTEQILKNEAIPEFLISLYAYNTYEQNASEYRYKESIMNYFNICNIEVRDAEGKYDIAEEILCREDIPNYTNVPSLNDNIWINEEYDNLFQYLPYYKELKKEEVTAQYICKILLKRQKLGLCTPSQKLSISKHCLSTYFVENTPESVLSFVWKKY